MTKRLPGYAKSLGLLVGVYIVVFFSLACRRYNLFRSDSGDFALFNNMFWWTVHGRPFYASALGFSNFGIHSAFLWAQLVPIYWLFPGVKTLIFMQTVFLGICAVPMYLIAQKLLDDHRASLILAAAFILFPSIVSQNVNQVEEPSFIAVYLLFAFYWFMMERFGLFLLFAFIACLGRENVPLAVAMFGVYAVVLRRSAKWIIAPLTLGGFMFAVLTFVLMPWFRQGFHWHVMGMFSYLGKTPGEIVGNALAHPGLVLEHVTNARNIQYFVFLIQPLGWILPFGTAAWLMALPDLGINLVSDNSALKEIGWHYNVITAVFLFISAIGTLRKIRDWLDRRWGKGQYATILAMGILVMIISHRMLWLDTGQFHPFPQHESLVKALATVPPGKSVIVPIRMQGQVSDRAWYGQNNYFVEKPEFAHQFEYVILDASERQYPPAMTQEFFDSFWKNPEYQMIFSENGVFVFHRLGGESDWKYNPWEGVR